MQTEARRWRDAFLRLTALAQQTGDPIVCAPPRWSREEMNRHLDYVEMSAGFRLPPSYRNFLLEHDGCRNLFRGAGLYSLAQLLDPMQASAANTALEDLNTPIPSYVAPTKEHWRDERMLCIGMDTEGEIVFVLDPTTVLEDGEMEIIAWFSGLGMRLPSFAHLLELLGDLMAATKASGPTTRIRPGTVRMAHLAA